MCPSKDLCQNMRYVYNFYLSINLSIEISSKVIRAEGRGWGLVAGEPIKKGAFVIEYVGELITMEEYRSSIL